LVGFGQSPQHALGIEVVGVDWCAGLLPPGLIQTSGINAIKAKFINEFEDGSLGCRVVPGNRKGNAICRTLRPA